MDTSPARPSLLAETPLRKGVVFRCLNKADPRYDQTGIVVKATALRLDVRWDADTPTGVAPRRLNYDERFPPTELRKAALQDYYAECDVGTYFRDYLDAHIENDRIEGEKYRERALVRNRERYIAKRRETEPEFEQQAGWSAETLHFGTMTKGGYIRQLIDVHLSPDTFMPQLPRIESVSWSSIGSVTPEYAINFANAVIQAANIAIAHRAEKEAALGIDITHTEEVQNDVD